MSVFLLRSVQMFGGGGSRWGVSQKIERLWDTGGIVAHIPKQRHGQNARVPAQGKPNDKNSVFCLIFHHYICIALGIFCLLIFGNVYSVAVIFISLVLVEPMEYCKWLFLQEIGP